MTINSKRKGRSFEHEVRNIFRAAGFDAIRTPEYTPDDVLVPLDGRDWKVECKRRRRGFCSLYDFLSKADYVVHRDDRRDPLITMPLDRFLSLVEGR